MSMTQSHSAMLKRFMKEELFEAKFAERSYIWKNIKKNLNWAGGVYEVPVKKSGFSSVQMGSLPDEADIAEGENAVGTINAHKELAMTALFREADLSRHSYSEQTYLDLIPDMVDDLTKTAVEQMESGFLRGSGTISYASGDGAADGTIAVTNIEYFQPGQKVEVIDDNTALVVGYIRQVDLANSDLLIYDARSGGAVVDLTNYTAAQNARVRLVGAGSESFLGLKSALLPTSLGGSDSIYGLTKLDYLPLQAYRATGAAFTADTILKDLLKKFFENRRLGRGEVSEIWVNSGMFANISANLELNKHYMVKDRSAGYGFNSVSLVGTEGEVKIVSLNHMETSNVIFWDWKAAKFAGLPMKKKMYGEAGVEYYVKRATTGISFISDIVLRGDFVIEPGKLGIVHSIPAACSQ